MTLIQFLIAWSHFITTHVCQVWQPDSSGLGNHIIYGGSCGDGFNLARDLHTSVTWSGVDQGTIRFP